MRRSLSLLLLAAQQIAAAQQGWVAVVPPREGSEEARCANWAHDEWTVVSQDSGVRFRRQTAGKWADVQGLALWVSQPEQTASQTVDLAEGLFTSINRGEFGGSVSFVPNDGQPIQRVAETNLVAFIPTRTGLFGLIGLAHASNVGALVRFERGPDSIWRMRTVADLGAAPHIYTQTGEDTLLVALSGALVSVELSGRVRVVHRNPVWSGTYPNSIARDPGGRIYVGMRSAVARLTPSVNGLVEDWLVTSDCVRRVAYPTPVPLCDCV
jgi:hypothetical protein